MDITNLLIHLQNNTVTAFSNNEMHIARIMESFPDTCITIAAGKADFLDEPDELNHSASTQIIAERLLQAARLY